MDFPRWYMAMMQALMDFLGSAVFLPHRRYCSSLPLQESVRHLQVLREVGVKPVAAGTGVAGGGDGEDAERRLGAMPEAVAQALRHTLSMLDRVQENQLAKEAEWSDTWSDAHIRMAHVFATSSEIIRSRLGRDLDKVRETARKWNTVVDRMLSSQRAHLESKVKRTVQRWTRFLDQFEQDRPGSAEFRQVQQGLLEGVDESLRQSMRGGGSAGGGGSFSSVVQHFVDYLRAQRPRGAPAEPAPQSQAWDRIESQAEDALARVLALEHKMATNRKQRHQLWMDAQHDPQTHMDRLARLDSDYVELEKELRVISTVRQDTLRRRQQHVQELADNTHHAQTPDQDPWERLAWRFATPILEMENQIFRFNSLAKRNQQQLD